MNTNSNTYTVIYSIILVVVVAAVLAFVAKFLQPMQEANVKKDTISQILTAAEIKFDESNILETYQDSIEIALLVDLTGKPVDTLDTNAKTCKVYSTSDLKKQISASDKKLPVYIFKNGITVIPCYGAGLWGPIWGYIGLTDDYTTIKAVCFGHKGETPGLGAKIADEPSFALAFAGKQIGAEKDKFFEISKPGTKALGDAQHVDAISGATITSQALGKTLNQWFGFYEGYLSNKKANAEANTEAVTEAETGENSENVEQTKNEEK